MPCWRAQDLEPGARFDAPRRSPFLPFPLTARPPPARPPPTARRCPCSSLFATRRSPLDAPMVLLLSAPPPAPAQNPSAGSAQPLQVFRKRFTGLMRRLRVSAAQSKVPKLVTSAWRVACPSPSVHSCSCSLVQALAQAQCSRRTEPDTHHNTDGSALLTFPYSSRSPAWFYPRSSYRAYHVPLLHMPHRHTRSWGSTRTWFCLQRRGPSRIALVLGSWVGIQHSSYLLLFLTAPRMVLPQYPSTNAHPPGAGRNMERWKGRRAPTQDPSTGLGC